MRPRKGNKTFLENSVASARKAGLLLVVLSVCAGCAARRTVFTQPYRLTGTGGAGFLLPPDFSPTQGHSTVTPVLLGDLNKDGRTEQAPKCSIRGLWFSLARGEKKEGWIAELPAPDAWYNNDLVAHSREHWNRFFDKIYDLESKGCITPQGYRAATDLIRESMPAPGQLASFFRDPLDDHGFVDLQPDTRLFVERSLFRAPGAETVANYAGEMKVYYSVVQKRSDEIGLKLHKIQRSAGLPRSMQHGIPDARLAQHFGSAGALRLFVLTRYIPPNLKRTALLIGVQNPADMVEVSRRIEKQPEIPCKDLAGLSIACASFEGEVSASVELGVRVNGNEEFFPLGSTVESVVNSLPPQQRASAWKTLKVRRLFRGRRYDIEFHRDDPEVPKLTLVAGDSISWTGHPGSR
jgi:hypothetical protein